MSLRDDLAAVLGPGNDDETAYTQAAAVLEILQGQAVETLLDLVGAQAVVLTPTEARAVFTYWDDSWGWYGKPSDPDEAAAKDFLTATMRRIREETA